MVKLKYTKMISAVVLSKNEEENIEKCLKSLLFCDEILVIDDYSTDKTLEVAKNYNATIFKKSLEKDFSNQRNFGLKNAKNEWVLFVDSDEIITNKLQGEILSKVNENKYDGFYIKREDFLFEKKMKHGDVGNVSLLRLGKKEKGKWQGKVHETWEIKGDIGEMENAILHYPHQKISQFISEIDFYSTLRAEELSLKKKSAGLIAIIFFPKLKFINLYILKLGFLDGIEGLIHAIFMSLYSFLVRGKLYLLQNK